MRIGEHPAQDNPMWHLQAYGLQNPMVAECIAKGVYDEVTCQHCRRGRTRDGYTCFHCQGTGFRRSRPLCQQDFGDMESLELAMQVMPELREAVAKPFSRAGMGFRARQLR